MELHLLEIKELALIHGWPSAMAHEILMARERIPALEAYIKSLHDENIELKALLRAYANQQMKMIDELRELRKALEAVPHAALNRSA